MVKTLPAIQETQVQSLGWKDPLEKEMATFFSILPRESYGQRSWVGYSPWSHKDLDTTERLILLTFTFKMTLNTPEIYRLFFLKKNKKVLSLQISFPQGNILLIVSCVLLDAFLVTDIFYTFLSPTKHATVLSKLLPYKRWTLKSHEKPSLQDS